MGSETDIKKEKNKFERLAVFLIGTAIFLSSFLLFLIQPMISKYFLPWFGGISSVWTMAVLFFQFSLLVGYYYSCVLSKKSLSFQFVFHGLVIVIIVFLSLMISRGWPSPITPGNDFKSFSVSPISGLLFLLSISVGLPYIVLSATSPLLQQWIGRLFLGDKAYRLYGLSNFGSFVGLLSYPFFFEPNLTLRGQANLWFWLFFLEVGILIGMILFFQKHKFFKKKEEGGDNNEENRNEESETKKTSQKTIRSWIFLAAVPSVMMLALTNYLSQGVAPFPLLWLVPLALYLVSFMICFRPSFRPSVIYPAIFFIGGFLTLILVGPMSLGGKSLMFKFIIVSITLFSSSILCHWRIYISRPNLSQMTTFYLAISAGGALGGFFSGIVAPAIFCEFFEIQISVLAVGYILFKSLPAITEKRRFFGHKLVIFLFRFSVAVLMLMGFILSLNLSSDADGGKIISMKRNFYGKLTIKKDKKHTEMYNGQILHGLQPVDENKRLKPGSYYASDSGVGLAFSLKKEIQKDSENISGIKSGIIGLGVGTIAAYCSSGDEFTFYEINPDVVKDAKKYFSYLEGCPNKKIVLGDARMALEKETVSKGNRYDILVVDAFTDDSIPVHLLTKEAVSLYFKNLSDDGILAFHISNRNLDLEPVLAGIADNLGLSSTVVELVKDKNAKGEILNADGDIFFESRWVLMARSEEMFERPIIKKASRPLIRKSNVNLWTDDYSNILSVLKF